jgi:hypothetical protein
MEYKILSIVYPKIGGCQFYRQVHPHEGINTVDFRIDTLPSLHMLPSKELSSYHLVQFHKNYVSTDILQDLKGLGIRTIVDFDDYWELPGNHLSYRKYQEDKQTGKLIRILKTADYITCTTGLLAVQIRKYNKNVFVIPNALDSNHRFAKQINVPSEKLRFGYLAGSCHKPDVELLRGLNNKLLSRKFPYELHLFGYKWNSVYVDYVKILTSEGIYKDNFYLHEALPCPDYLVRYNQFDVPLVPLKANLFNSLKSELKLLEAGIFRKTVIASESMPYKPFLKHHRNCLVAKGRNDWVRQIQFLANNPQASKDFGEQLHMDIQKQFNYEKITRTRTETYRYILSKG